MRGVTLLIVAAAVVGCESARHNRIERQPGSVEGHPDSAIWKAVLPLDTAFLLGMLALVDSNSTRSDLAGESSVAWQGRIDAVTVRNMMPACTCPDYIVLDSARIGVRDVYLVPANETIRIPESMDVAGNTFVLIGQRSVDTLRPPQTMGPPWPGYFFRYLSYRVVRPYRVWGPRVFEPSADTVAGEEPWIPSQLTVY